MKSVICKKYKLIYGDIFDDGYTTTDNLLNLQDVELLLPVNPTKIIALGYNYKDLVGDLHSYNEPVIFLKPPSSVITEKDTIEIKSGLKTWTEVELAIVVGKKATCVSKENAADFIFGYTVANDVTSQNILNRDHHLARSKGWDTYCPIGNFIVTDVDTSDLKMYNKINGKIFQNSTTKNRILNDLEIIALLSSVMTLNPGDVILTGTPANAENSVIKNGDKVEVYIEGIGSLTNNVIVK